MFEIFKLKKFNKKGALELSVNAIVIVVIAMTLLGLGLGFIRGMFTRIGGITEATFEKISEQLSTDLATSEAPLLFSKTRLTIERGGSSLEGIGIRNDGDSTVNYGIRVGTFNCPVGAQVEEDACYDTEDWFEYFKGANQYTIRAAERQVNKVQINIPKKITVGTASKDTPSGLYLLKIMSYTGVWPDDDNCVGANDCDIFGQTELFLTVA
jgi:hypothetical protein